MFWYVIADASTLLRRFDLCCVMCVVLDEGCDTMMERKAYVLVHPGVFFRGQTDRSLELTHCKSSTHRSLIVIDCDLHSSFFLHSPERKILITDHVCSRFTMLSNTVFSTKTKKEDGDVILRLAFLDLRASL
jgi:hypothetical protein